MRVDLEVPYSEKDQAKALGARWDPGRRTWYVVDQESLYPFLKWIPERLKAPHRQKPSDRMTTWSRLEMDREDSKKKKRREKARAKARAKALRRNNTQNDTRV